MAENEPIRTFSGTHAWNPSVLVDTDAHEGGTDEDIVWNINAGRCPRCEGPLPTMPEFPAGSRITKCRSIPICGRCGGDEVYEQLDGALSGASCWPLPVAEIEERRARHEKHRRPATLSDGVLLTDDGVTQVVNPRNTGGWAQYGFPEED